MRNRTAPSTAGRWLINDDVIHFVTMFDKPSHDLAPFHDFKTQRQSFGNEHLVEHARRVLQLSWWELQCNALVIYLAVNAFITHISSTRVIMPVR